MNASIAQSLSGITSSIQQKIQNCNINKKALTYWKQHSTISQTKSLQFTDKYNTIPCFGFVQM